MKEEVNKFEEDIIIVENKGKEQFILFFKKKFNKIKVRIINCLSKFNVFIDGKKKSIKQKRIISKRKKLQYATLLEKPIDSQKEDKFGIEPYVRQVNYAIKKGANFIAINGEYGSGKSSIVNVFKKSKNSFWKRLWMKNTFVNINFMNINEKMIDDENFDTLKTPYQFEQLKDIRANTINNYHRYLVNQVANDIYRHPYEIEKLFYRNTLSYTIVKKINNLFLAFIVDKLLLILTSTISLVIIYMTFFNISEESKKISIFEDLYGMILPKLPFLLLLFLIISVIYGFGISKPDNESKSPMLDVDKCRNNFCKVIFNKLNWWSTLYLVIDDLDRIDSELQAQILSLLNNEYYPLNRVIKKIRIVFICMINLKGIEPNLKKINLDGQKLFDYILDVSNNQSNILTHYILDSIENGKTNLNYIFNNTKHKNYLISLIVNFYDSIRKIKHCLSKIISKYNYLNYKKIDINYSQLIFFTILQDNYKTDEIMKVCETILQNEISIENEIDNADKDDFSIIIKSKIIDAYKKGIIDENYYIYLYNFMDKSNLLNYSELELCKFSKESSLLATEDEINHFYELMNNINEERYHKIYSEIFKYCQDENKLLFFQNKRFLEFALKMDEIDNLVDLRDIYKRNYISEAYSNIHDLCNFNKYKISNIIFKDLYELNKKRLVEPSDSNNTNYLEELSLLFDGIKISVYNRLNLVDLLKNLKLNNTIFEDLFTNLIYNNIPIGYELFIDGTLKYENLLPYFSLDIINKLHDLDKDIHLKIINLYWKCNIDIYEQIKIACDNRYKIDDINKLLEKINNSAVYLTIEDIKLIITNYGYNVLLEKHMINVLDDKDNHKILINFIKENEFEITSQVMDKLQDIPFKYSFSKFYESRFINTKHYKLYTYSKTIESKIFEIRQKNKNVPEYKNAIKEIYEYIGTKWAKYQFGEDFVDFILNNYEFNGMAFNDNNFWKIKILTNKINNTVISNKIFYKVYADGTFINLCSYCSKKSNNITNKMFLQLLKNYAINKNIDSHVVGKITARINNL